MSFLSGEPSHTREHSGAMFKDPPDESTWELGLANESHDPIKVTGEEDTLSSTVSVKCSCVWQFLLFSCRRRSKMFRPVVVPSPPDSPTTPLKNPLKRLTKMIPKVTTSQQGEKKGDKYNTNS